MLSLVGGCPQRGTWVRVASVRAVDIEHDAGVGPLVQASGGDASRRGNRAAAADPEVEALGIGLVRGSLLIS